MDIAYYISDLLGQQGELTVPNLGYFVQIRMPAYYNGDEQKFHPPHYSVQFDPQIIDDDDALANHITAVKKISVSSAKYFIEKYINNLKSQSFIEDVPFANLGSFSSDGIRLSFNTNTKTDDPTFFAYPAVDAAKMGEAPIRRATVTAEPEVIAPVISEPVYIAPAIVEAYTAPEPAVVTPEPVYVPEPAYTAPTPVVETQTDMPVNTPFFGGELVSSRVNPGETLEEPKRLGIWLIVAIVFALLIIGLVALYKFKPGLFQKKYNVPAATQPIPVIKDTTPTTPATQTPLSQDTGKVDSSGLSTKGATQPVTKPGMSTKDTAKVGNFSTIKTKPTPVAVVKTPPVAPVATANAVIPPGINNPMPEIVPKGADIITAGAFAQPLKSRALARVAELKKKGFPDARLLTDKVGRGGNYKVIVGVYANKDYARQAKKAFLATGKLKEEDISVEQNKKSLD